MCKIGDPGLLHGLFNISRTSQRQMGCALRSLGLFHVNTWNCSAVYLTRWPSHSAFPNGYFLDHNVLSHFIDFWKLTLITLCHLFFFELGLAFKAGASDTNLHTHNLHTTSGSQNYSQCPALHDSSRAHQSAPAFTEGPFKENLTWLELLAINSSPEGTYSWKPTK